MAKLLGLLVGTLVAKAGFAGVSNFLKDGSDHILVRDNVVFLNTNVIGDTVSLGFFKSTALISPTAKVWFDAFGAAVKMNIGDVAHPTGLANQIDVSAAGNADLWKGFTAASMGIPLWKALGYGADPGGVIELLGTIAGANVVNNNVNFAWQIAGINR
ncbi:hypothetical protein [Phenylobacterium sp.]|uniref:hypothetical protein n=1 Tax=Phenylobacterium sp. TaxID=1871053 RepID=UPI002DEF5705|nr:hypothetical protein [Phenylobacterium sp.]